MAGAMGRVAGLFLAGKGRRAGRRFQRTGRILPGCGLGVNPAGGAGQALADGLVGRIRLSAGMPNCSCSR